MADQSDKASRLGIWIIALIVLIALVAVIWFVTSSQPVRRTIPGEGGSDAETGLKGDIGRDSVLDATTE